MFREFANNDGVFQISRYLVTDDFVGVSFYLTLVSRYGYEQYVLFLNLDFARFSSVSSDCFNTETWGSTF